MRVWTRRRSLLPVFAVVALVSFAVAVTSAGARIESRVHIHYLNNSCSVDNGNLGHGLGIVKFYNRHGDSVRLLVSMKRGDPDARYTLYLWDANSCTQFGSAIGTIDGNDRARLTVDLAGHTSVVLNAYDGVNNNATEIVDFG